MTYCPSTARLNFFICQRQFGAIVSKRQVGKLLTMFPMGVDTWMMTRFLHVLPANKFSTTDRYGANQPLSLPLRHNAITSHCIHKFKSFVPWADTGHFGSIYHPLRFHYLTRDLWCLVRGPRYIFNETKIAPRTSSEMFNNQLILKITYA